MKPIFKCEFHYIQSPHLYQIYDGFEKLRRRGIVDLTIRPKLDNDKQPLLKVLVNNKFNVIYDTLDGLNWVKGSKIDNINFFKENIDADYYFKRSFLKELKNNSPKKCQVYPLGLNFYIDPEGKYPMEFMDKLKKIYYDFNIIKYLEKSNNKFEYYPILNKKSKILFLTRLWDPSEAKTDYLKYEREKINKDRINYIAMCRKEFGKDFIGGLKYDRFSEKNCKELVMPSSLTNKSSFLNCIKNSNICIATDGLHNSIGWKFAEYVAASRAIITEPLSYDLPGDFNVDKNYQIFNKDNLINKINELLNDKNKMKTMMINNFNYYNNYVRSDVLVLNSLLKLPSHKL